LESKV